MLIHYIGLEGTSGYAVSARVLIELLRKQGIKIIFTPVTTEDIERSKSCIPDESVCDETCTFDFIIVHTVPEFFPYWYAKEKQRSPEAKIWGYTTWENFDTPENWPLLINLMDALFVPCEMNKTAFEKSGVVKPIYILPHVSQFQGLNIPASTEWLNSILEPVSDCFIFYFIGEWTDRKAPWKIIQAFNNEFDKCEHVALILKTGTRDWTKTDRKLRNLFRRSEGLSSDAFRRFFKWKNKRIIHITKELSDSEIMALHNNCHCFISLTRGEGWGMPSYEAAWYGKPIIITGFGGFLDYLSQENAYLVDFKLVANKVRKESLDFFNKQHWADVNLKHAEKIMRKIFTDQKEINLKSKFLIQSMKDKFSSCLISNIFIKSILNEQNS